MSDHKDRDGAIRWLQELDERVRALEQPEEFTRTTGTEGWVVGQDLSEPDGYFGVEWSLGALVALFGEHATIHGEGDAFVVKHGTNAVRYRNT